MPGNDWPEIELARWQDTCETVHLWTQVIGKIRMALMPWINHSWHVPLYVTVRGLGTGPMPIGQRALQIDFDFIDHHLDIRIDDGRSRRIGLGPMSVAAFHRAVLDALAGLGLEVRIWPVPVEIPGEVQPFHLDESHAAYDADAVSRFWRALVQVDRVFTVFRARFLGKVSPVHFFWGAFDLAVTRFSGRTAPRHPGGAPNCPDWVMQEAYSHEVSSAGFWPGAGLGDAAFYSYAWPEPAGFRECPVQPAAAYWHEGLGEFILPYEAVRRASEPEQLLLEFLQSTYEAAARLAHWDRQALERRQ